MKAVRSKKILEPKSTVFENFMWFQDLSAVIKKTANFLGKDLTNEQVSSLKQHLSFESMKKNPCVNRDEEIKKIIESKIYGENLNLGKGSLMRTGNVGGWKTVMSMELIQQFDDWTNEQLKDYEDFKNEFK